MVLSRKSVTWGLQFSYPQLYQDPRTRQIFKVTDTPEFPNTALFSKLQKWIRSETLPTPFQVEASVSIRRSVSEKNLLLGSNRILS